MQAAYGQVQKKAALRLFLLSLAALFLMPRRTEATGGSPSLAQTAIEAAYQKSCIAAKLKYVDGVFSIRSDDFRYVGRSRYVSPTLVRSTLEDYFSRALRVREDKKILSFKMLAPTRVRCEVKDILEVVVPTTLPKPPMVHVFECNSIDEWTKTRETWELTASEQSQTDHSLHPELSGGATPTPAKSASEQ